MAAKDTVKVDSAKLQALMELKKLTNTGLSIASGVELPTLGRIIKNGAAKRSNVERLEMALQVPRGTLQLRAGAAPVPQEQTTPGLESFLEGHRGPLAISRREEWYLRNSTFKAEPWVAFTDEFWSNLLIFWRNFLKTVDK